MKIFLSLLFILSFSALHANTDVEVADKGFKFSGVQLDKSDFIEVKNIFGETDIFQKIDPSSHSLTWICYKNKKYY